MTESASPPVRPAAAGATWEDRYFAVKGDPRARFRCMPEELGPTPPGDSAYARNNDWQLRLALARGVERVRFIALWDGRPGDGGGGTADMVEEARRLVAAVHLIDPTRLE